MQPTKQAITNTTQQPSLLENYSTQAVKQLGQIIGGELLLLVVAVIGIVLKNKWTLYSKIKQASFDLLDPYGYQERLRTKLAALLIMSEADRILLVQFHSYNSLPFYGNTVETRCSLTHQFLADNISGIPVFKDTMISQIYRELKDLKESKTVWISKDSAMSGCAKYLDRINVKHYGARLIRSELGLPLAIIGLHYCEKELPPNITITCEDIIDKLEALIKVHTT